MAFQHIYVKLVQDEDGYPPFKVEELDAVDVGNGRYQIRSLPLFVVGLAENDVVETQLTPDDELRWVTGVAEESGSWLARVILRTGSTVEAEDIVSRFREMGCRSYETQFGLVPVGVPHHVNAASVLTALEDGQTRGRWYFDLGVAPG